MLTAAERRSYNTLSPDLARGGRSNHVLLQTKNTMSNRYLPILSRARNLPSGGVSSPVDRDALSRGHETPRLAHAEGGQACKPPARAELGTRQPKSGTDGSNPVPSSGESCKPDQPANPARLRPRELRTCDQAMANRLTKPRHRELVDSSCSGPVDVNLSVEKVRYRATTPCCV